jgi:hypothetical protein
MKENEMGLVCDPRGEKRNVNRVSVVKLEGKKPL